MTASSNAKGTPYHRFIPREEVQTFTAWEFPSMDGKPGKASKETPPANA